MPATGARVGMIRQLLRATFALALLLAAFAAAVWGAWPWLVGAVGPRLAQPLGLDELRVDAGRPGLASITVRDLHLVRGAVRVSASGGDVGYRLRGLAAGRLESAHFARMTVRLGRSDATRGAAPAADADSVFAALPAKRVEVDLLQVEVPALDFLARGQVQMTPAALDVRLEGASPARAQGLALAVRVTPEGLIDLHLADGSGARFLHAESVVAPGRIDLAGEVDLGGFALDLAAELVGLPQGRGAVTGGFAATLPWPLPEPMDWRVLQATGRAHADWQAAGGEYGLSDVSLDGRVDAGVVSGAAAAQVTHGGHAFAANLQIERFDWPLGEGLGTVRLGPAAAPTAPAYAALGWAVSAGELRLEGDYSLRDDLLALADDLAGRPLGHGALDGQAAVTLPRPLPGPGDLLDCAGCRAEGDVRGHWQWPARSPGREDAVEPELLLQDIAGSWLLAEGRLAGQWRAGLEYGAVRTPLRLSLQPIALAAVPLTIAGTLEVGSLGTAPFVTTYHPERGSGSLSAQAEVAVSVPLAASVMAEWPARYDLVAGQLSLQAGLGWSAWPRLNGSLTIDLQDVSAHYEDYLVEGTNGTLEFAVRDGDWSLQPSELRARALQFGVTVERVHSGLAWTADTVAIATTTAEVLGGRVRVPAFDYHIPTGEAYLTVDLDQLDLAEILALEGDQVAGTGRLSGTLPVTLKGNAVSISGGSVRADASGGRLEVSPALAGAADMPGFDFALRALQNFHYVVLRGEVSYSEQGDMVLGVQLEGRNPDVEGGRRINYNLNITENIPVLLKSLRMEDELTRSIERRLSN
jgi:hypothetical protein